jgi:hypothetical protein
MSDLTSSVFQQLDQSHIESIAQQLGVDPAKASDAVQQALPLLMGGLARNAASPQGADALHSALERDHAGTDIGGLLGSVFGGGNSGGIKGLLGSVLGGGGAGGLLGSVFGGNSADPAASGEAAPGTNPSATASAPSAGGGIGESILGHIFGGRSDQAAQGLGQTSGLGAAGATKLLALLSPVVMGVLGNMTQKQGLDANGLSGVLGQESNRLQQSGIGGLLSGVFDRDGDGKVSLDEMKQAGAGLLGGLGKHLS